MLGNKDQQEGEEEEVKDGGREEEVKDGGRGGGEGWRRRKNLKDASESFCDTVERLHTHSAAGRRGQRSNWVGGAEE